MHAIFNHIQSCSFPAEMPEMRISPRGHMGHGPWVPGASKEDQTDEGCVGHLAHGAAIAPVVAPVVSPLKIL